MSSARNGENLNKAYIANSVYVLTYKTGLQSVADFYSCLESGSIFLIKYCLGYQSIIKCETKFLSNQLLK